MKIGNNNLAGVNFLDHFSCNPNSARVEREKSLSFVYYLTREVLVNIAQTGEANF